MIEECTGRTVALIANTILGRAEDTFICTKQKKCCIDSYAIDIGYKKWTLITKGQLISKGHFAILNSSIKRTKKFDLTTMISQVDLFSFVFWKTFRN